jgi:mRNA interferase MazF
VTSRPRQGDVWWIDLRTPVGNEQGYRRPAVVVSADAFNRLKEDLVFVVPMTTRERGKPYHVKIDPLASGLTKMCWAQVEDLRSVSLARLQEHVGEVDEGTLAEIGEIIRLLMGLS